MTTTQQRLADALRAALPWVQVPDNLVHLPKEAREALAAYDAHNSVADGIPVTKLKRSHFKTPFEAGAREESVTNNGRTYHVALAHESKGGWYYTIRGGRTWAGYRTVHSIEAVKSAIRGDA